MREVGDFAVRGGILDCSSRARSTIRLDFFGDTLESIRAFDPTAATTGQLRPFDLPPMSEVELTTDTIRRFRRAYIESSAPLAPTIPSMRRSARAAAPPASNIGCPYSMKSWKRCSTISGRPVVSTRAPRSWPKNRFGQIEDYYAARKHGDKQDPAAHTIGR